MNYCFILFQANQGREKFTIYDGAIVLEEKSSAINTFLGMLNSLFGTPFQMTPQNVKASREAGCSAMWPDWIEEIRKGASLGSILEWVAGVFIHQSKAVQNFRKANTDNHKIRDVGFHHIQITLQKTLFNPVVHVFY